MRTDSGAVLITGAYGHLGRAVTHAFKGRDVVLLDLPGVIEANQGQAESTHLPLGCDLLDAEAVAQAVGMAVEQVGPIFVVCNIAGGFRMGEPVHETSDSTWQYLLDVNVRTILHTSRAVVPGMVAAGRGAVVNVSANAALRGVAYMGMYAASKSAVARLTESMSAELRAHGINVNCVMPSIIDTPENRSAMPEAEFAHWVAPADLAAVVRFLASDAARAIHGACIPVTGLS